MLQIAQNRAALRQMSAQKSKKTKTKPTFSTRFHTFQTQGRPKPLYKPTIYRLIIIIYSPGWP